MSYAGKRVGVTAWWGAIALLGAAGGCAMSHRYSAYTRPTASQIAQAESSVGNARAVGAERDANAAAFLATADRELASAKRSMDLADDRSANWMLQRAIADADLSRALVQRAHEEREAKSSETQLTQLRQQTANPSTSNPSAPETETTTPQRPSDAPAD
jgi:hypothetical protein